jgi:hypothetical protein
MHLCQSKELCIKKSVIEEKNKVKTKTESVVNTYCFASKSASPAQNLT